MSEEKPQRKASKQVKRTGDKLSPKELPFDRNGPGGRFDRSTQGDFPEETANKTLEFSSVNQKCIAKKTTTTGLSWTHHGRSHCVVKLLHTNVCLQNTEVVGHLCH